MNFEDIANSKMSEIEAPTVLPEGTYLAKVAKPYEESQRGEDDKFTVITFPCEILEAGDQIKDPEALEAYGDPAGKSFRIEFWFNTSENLSGEDRERNDTARRKMAKWLEDALEIDAETLKDAMTEAMGHQFYAVITHQKNDNDPEVPYLRCNKWAPVE